MISEPPSETELGAYLDGELDLPEQLRVEDYLASQPPAAAELMAHIRIRTALRLLARDDVASSEPTVLLPERASRFIPQPKLLRWCVRAAVAVAVVAGLGAVTLPTTSLFASPPEYVSDALMAHKTGLLRANMASQLETPIFDAEEILHSTSIRIPKLPEGWTITDVQVFPSDVGPSLQIMVRKPDQQDVSIFAVRAPSSAPSAPVAIRRGNESVAYWRNHEISYALTGAEPPEALDLAAEDLAGERS